MGLREGMGDEEGDSIAEVLDDADVDDETDALLLLLLVIFACEDEDEDEAKGGLGGR